MRVFSICLVAVMMVILAPVLSLLVGVMAAFVSHVAGYVAGIAVLVLVEGTAIYVLLFVVRKDAWLEDSILVVRTALTTRRLDLAHASTAKLRWQSEAVPVYGPNGGAIGMMPSGSRIPVLFVRDRGGGKPLRLSLIDPGTRKPLEAPALLSLASAVQSSGYWPGRDSRAIQHVVSQLYAMANSGPQLAGGRPAHRRHLRQALRSLVRRERYCRGGGGTGRGRTGQYTRLCPMEDTDD